MDHLDDWLFKVLRTKLLEKGWDGYKAEPPSSIAISNACQFLYESRFEPSRVAPSVVGGIGITFRMNKHNIYLEFFNDGEVYLLQSDKNDDIVSYKVLDFIKLAQEL